MDNFNSVTLRARLATVEGDRALAYDDASGLTIVPGRIVRGNVTVGIGRNLYGKGLSPVEIQYLLSNDIEDAAAYLREVFGITWTALNDARQRALIEMVFNLGVHTFGEFVGLIECIEKDDFAGAALAALASKAAAELPTRYKAIAAMLRDGV